MVVWPKSVVVYTDGASRGNPGPASIGVHIEDFSGITVFDHWEHVGLQTNNFAEYTAVIRGLQICAEQFVDEVTVKSDSEFMIRQLTGAYKVKSETIKPLFNQAKTLITKFKSVNLVHVRREFNKIADELANRALDEL